MVTILTVVMVTRQSHVEVRMDLTSTCSRQNVQVNVGDCVLLVVLMRSVEPERNSTQRLILESGIKGGGKASCRTL